MDPSDLPVIDSSPLGTHSSDARSWRYALLATAIALVALVLAYWDSVVSMVQTWERSGTYAHGFVVFPVSAWLIWRQRAALALVTPRPFLPGALMLGVLSCVWLVGWLTTIQTFQEFALVASVPILIWTILGNRAAYTIGAPLAFMLFAWPFGEFLVPPMIDWTADFAVSALRVTGIPVYREGNNFVIPSGSWSVVDACSGIRYLIASFYAGCIFAALNYRSVKRRLLFLGFCTLVPILANWIRAYLIVLIGYLSDNRIATGIDHVIYGWIFFGLVMAIVFYIGMRFSDVKIDAPSAPSSTQPSPPPAGRLQRFTLAAVAAACLAGVGPVLAHILEADTAAAVVLDPPALSEGWKLSGTKVTDWKPPFPNPTASLEQAYRNGGDEVGLYVVYYRNQRTGAKLLTFGSTILTDYDSKWRAAQRRVVSVDTAGGTFPVIEKLLRSQHQKLLTWQWYWIGGEQTVSFWDAKLMQARAKLLGRGDDAAVVVVCVPYRDNPSAAREALIRFIQPLRSGINQTLTAAASR